MTGCSSDLGRDRRGPPAIDRLPERQICRLGPLAVQPINAGNIGYSPGCSSDAATLAGLGADADARYDNLTLHAHIAIHREADGARGGSVLGHAHRHAPHLTLRDYYHGDHQTDHAVDHADYSLGIHRHFALMLPMVSP